MSKSSAMKEVTEIAEKLTKLKELNIFKFYEYKGRIDAVYERETEPKTVSSWYNKYCTSTSENLRAITILVIFSLRVNRN